MTLPERIQGCAFCQKAQGTVATNADRTDLTGEEQKEWEGRKRKMQGCFPD